MTALEWIEKNGVSIYPLRSETGGIAGWGIHSEDRGWIMYRGVSLKEALRSYSTPVNNSSQIPVDSPQIRSANEGSGDGVAT